MTGAQKVCCFGAIMLLAFAPTAWGTSKLFDFEGTEFGANDPTCSGTAFPVGFKAPIFNMAIYGTQTTSYVDGAAECGGGALGASPVNVASYSFLTNYYSLSPSKSEEIRFSWKDPTNVDSWARIPAFATGTAQQPVARPNPTIDIRAGSSVKMSFLVYLADAAEASNSTGTIEVALAVRETGLNLPLGEDGGIAGNVEFVGVTTTTGTGKIPTGGVVLNNDVAWHTIEWTFKNDTQVPPKVTLVDVSVDGGAATEMKIADFAGNSELSAAFNRGTLDSLVVIKGVGDTTTKKVFINVDDVEIKAPAVASEPVQVLSPLVEFMTSVSIAYVDPAATLVKLYQNGTPVASGNPGGNTSYTFTGITMVANDQMTATQVVGGESEPSAPVTVASAILFSDDFESYADMAALYAPGKWEEGCVSPTSASMWTQVRQYMEAKPTISTVTSASCNKSVLVPESSGGTHSYRLQIVKRIPGAKEAGGYNGSDEVPLVLTFYAKADDGADARWYCEFQGFSLHEYANWSFKQRIRVGTFAAAGTQCDGAGTLDTSVYQCHFLQGYTGCVANLNQGPGGAKATRVAGKWVKFRVRVKTTTIEVLVNDVLYRVVDRPNNTDTYDTVGFGYGYTNTREVYFDNVTISYGDRDAFAAPVQNPIVMATVFAGTNQDVRVEEIDAAATNVKLFADGTEIASATPSGTVHTFTGLTLTAGQKIRAKQTVGGNESCIDDFWGGNVTVVDSGVTPISVSLMLRDAMASLAGPVGADGGAPSGAIEFLGATSLNGGAPIGKLVTPGPLWQTITFNAATDTAISFSGGNGVIDGTGAEKWCELDSLAITVSQDDTNTAKAGPYALYVDSIENNGTVFGNFDTYNVDDNVMFREAGYSGSTSANVGLGSISAVSADVAADGTANSCKLSWSYASTAKSTWARVTTYNMTNLGNPMVRMDQPVTMKFLLCGAPSVNVASPLKDGDTTVTVEGVDLAATLVKVYVNGAEAGSAAGGTSSVAVTVSALAENDVVQATQTIVSEGCFGNSVTVEAGTSCNTPKMDTNGDLHVDATDFDTFSACYNGPTNAPRGDCACLDSNGDSHVDATDFDVFSACYNGPTNAPRCAE